MLCALQVCQCVFMVSDALCYASSELVMLCALHMCQCVTGMWHVQPDDRSVMPLLYSVVSMLDGNHTHVSLKYLDCWLRLYQRQGLGL